MRTPGTADFRNPTPDRRPDDTSTFVTTAKHIAHGEVERDPLQEADRVERVALARSIGPQEDGERRQLDRLVGEALEVGEAEQVRRMMRTAVAGDAELEAKFAVC